MFLRGGTTSGAGEADAFQGHSVQSTLQVYASQLGSGDTYEFNSRMVWNQATLISTIISNGVNGPPRTGKETRPVNMSVSPPLARVREIAGSA